MSTGTTSTDRPATVAPRPAVSIDRARAAGRPPPGTVSWTGGGTVRAGRARAPGRPGRCAVSAPAPVQVSVWGELRGEQKLPGVLRVLVGGQHAGGDPARGSTAGSHRSTGCGAPSRPPMTPPLKPCARSCGHRGHAGSAPARRPASPGRIGPPARGQRLPGRCAVSPRGRHEAGAGRPGDEPWARTSDRSTWRAYKRGLMLTVTRLAGDGWMAIVEGENVTERSPVLATRLAAQRWADSRAGGAR